MVGRLLHGTLAVTIYEIDSLNNGCGFDMFSKCCHGPQKMGRRFLSKFKRLVICRPEIAGSRLYATVDLDKARVGRTRILTGQPSNPRWFESFWIYCAHTINHVIFTVKDEDPVGATLIGRAYLPVEDIIKGYIVDKWIPILDDDFDKSPLPGNPRIHVKLQFFNIAHQCVSASVAHDPTWSQGIRTPKYDGVPYAFFNQRHGCRVTLYQDAHVHHDNSFPIVYLDRDGNMLFEWHRCWEDIFDALINASYLIYITGWSLYTEIALVRDQNKPGYNMKLGELLKMKAEQGVTVLVMVWDDRTSVAELKRDGLMATHDEETEGYFRGTKVKCLLCPRNPDNGRSMVQGFAISAMFTHHQKTVVVDADGGGEGKRRIVSFVGGIDLCDGRYDTQDHPLFKTLNTVHREDFHQPNFPGATVKKGGPREPWHDVHCKLEGPVAWDVLYNFEQRWRKQAGEENVNLLIGQERLEGLISRPLPVLQPADPEAWNVQIFRSIDGGAVEGFPEKPEEAAAVGLISGKDNVVDRSIQDGYIHAIRRAKSFIYIENQYFLGSSFGWKQSGGDINVDDVAALHLIPKELSLKIVSKIEAGERFVVYVVIPMWPEGIPESESVQAILDWQRRTMEMMYADIAEALRRKGLNTSPREYLSFFCLGNRETKKVGEYVPEETPEPDSDYARAQRSRRFMIYVHAKMMIVDDEYIIIGSANINQRSMDGGRDTEIAMGAFQPQQIATASQPPTGQISRFRLALWFEHLGALDKSFQYPGSVRCVQLVNQIAEDNWEKYASESFDHDRKGHLLRYPVEVGGNGGVASLPGFEHFPDTKARVLGRKADHLPPILTT